MILSLYDSIDIQCVKIRLLYYGITLYQKSSGSNPDSETKTAAFAAFLLQEAEKGYICRFIKNITLE